MNKIIEYCKGKPRTVSFLLALLFFLCFLPFVPETVCDDGWRSSSIGSQGACSHHGGVGTRWSVVLFWLSVFIGLVFYCKLTYEKPKSKASARKQDTPYGSYKDYEEHLRHLGLSDESIVKEINKYKEFNSLHR